MIVAIKCLQKCVRSKHIFTLILWILSTKDDLKLLLAVDQVSDVAQGPLVYSTSIYPHHNIFHYEKDRSMYSLRYNKSFNFFNSLQTDNRMFTRGTDIRCVGPYICFTWMIVEQTTTYNRLVISMHLWIRKYSNILFKC